VLWNAKIEALRNVGLEVLEIVKNKKPTERASTTSTTRANPVAAYWYPGEAP
jgi:hypothetical protein